MRRNYNETNRSTSTCSHTAIIPANTVTATRHCPVTAAKTPITGAAVTKVTADTVLGATSQP